MVNPRKYFKEVVKLFIKEGLFYNDDVLIIDDTYPMIINKTIPFVVD